MFLYLYSYELERYLFAAACVCKRTANDTELASYYSHSVIGYRQDMMHFKTSLGDIRIFIDRKRCISRTSLETVAELCACVLKTRVSVLEYKFWSFVRVDFL